ncbi:PAS domain S-box protein [Natrialbaceae archaeon A-CW1-1]
MNDSSNTDTTKSTQGRPRVLCVSADRTTRAAVTRALVNSDVTVAIAQSSTDAIGRLECDRVDAIVVDAATVGNDHGLLDDVESRWPEIPAFVHWTGTDPQQRHLLGEIVSRTPVTGTANALSTTIVSRLESDTAPPLDRIAGRVKRRLADARTAGEIERAVRETLTDDDDRYVFAWLGEYDPGEREIIPWITDRTGVDWPMQRTFPIGSGREPLLEDVLRTREPRVVDRIDRNERRVPLGTDALDRGAASVAVLALATAEERFGVLVVYGTSAFTDEQRRTIESIAETASYALESIAIRGRLSQQEQSLRRYERLVEAAGDGMYVVDGDRHFTTVNDALVEMTGYSREGLLGEPLSLLFTEPQGDEVEDRVTEGEPIEDDVSKGGTRQTDHPLDRLVADGEPTTTFETVLETKSGTTIPCETQAALVAADDTFRGIVGVVRDITGRKRRERRLREQNERLDAFAGIVSHDLRNPLGVAQGYLELAEETGSTDHLETVHEGLDRMEAIIADVLTVAREGEWAVDVESHDLESVVTEAWENVSVDDAKLEIDSTITLEADRSPVLRLFENLFRNAVEHGIERSGDATPLTIRAGRLEETPGFYVADDGAGIPASIRDDLFDAQVSTGSEGIGLGLWVVKEVADGHGWTVLATSGPDGGARFEFRFEN